MSIRREQGVQHSDSDDDSNVSLDKARRLCQVGGRQKAPAAPRKPSTPRKQVARELDEVYANVSDQHKHKVGWLENKTKLLHSQLKNEISSTRDLEQRLQERDDKIRKLAHMVQTLRESQDTLRAEHEQQEASAAERLNSTKLTSTKYENRIDELETRLKEQQQKVREGVKNTLRYEQTIEDLHKETEFLRKQMNMSRVQLQEERKRIHGLEEDAIKLRQAAADAATERLSAERALAALQSAARDSGPVVTEDTTAVNLAHKKLERVRLDYDQLSSKQAELQKELSVAEDERKRLLSELGTQRLRTPTSPPAENTDDGRVDELLAQLSALRSQLRDARQEAAAQGGLRTKIKSLQEKHESAIHRIKNLEPIALQQDQTRQQLATVTRELTEERQERDELAAQLARTRASVDELSASLERTVFERDELISKVEVLQLDAERESADLISRLQNDVEGDFATDRFLLRWDLQSDTPASDASRVQVMPTFAPLTADFRQHAALTDTLRRQLHCDWVAVAHETSDPLAALGADGFDLRHAPPPTLADFVGFVQDEDEVEVVNRSLEVQATPLSADYVNARNSLSEIDSLLRREIAKGKVLCAHFDAKDRSVPLPVLDHTKGGVGLCNEDPTGVADELPEYEEWRREDLCAGDFRPLFGVDKTATVFEFATVSTERVRNYRVDIETEADSLETLADRLNEVVARDTELLSSRGQRLRLCFVVAPVVVGPSSDFFVDHPVFGRDAFQLPFAASVLGKIGTRFDSDRDSIGWSSAESFGDLGRVAALCALTPAASADALSTLMHTELVVAELLPEAFGRLREAMVATRAHDGPPTRLAEDLFCSCDCYRRLREHAQLLGNHSCNYLDLADVAKLGLGPECVTYDLRQEGRMVCLSTQTMLEPPGLRETAESPSGGDPVAAFALHDDGWRAVRIDGATAPASFTRAEFDRFAQTGLSRKIARLQNLLEAASAAACARDFSGAGEFEIIRDAGTSFLSLVAESEFHTKEYFACVPSGEAPLCERVVASLAENGLPDVEVAETAEGWILTTANDAQSLIPTDLTSPGLGKLLCAPEGEARFSTLRTRLCIRALNCARHVVCCIGGAVGRELRDGAETIAPCSLAFARYGITPAEYEVIGRQLAVEVESGVRITNSATTAATSTLTTAANEAAPRMAELEASSVVPVVDGPMAEADASSVVTAAGVPMAEAALPAVTDPNEAVGRNPVSLAAEQRSFHAFTLGTATLLRKRGERWTILQDGRSDEEDNFISRLLESTGYDHSTETYRIGGREHRVRFQPLDEARCAAEQLYRTKNGGEETAFFSKADVLPTDYPSLQMNAQTLSRRTDLVTRSALRL